MFSTSGIPLLVKPWVSNWMLSASEIYAEQIKLYTFEVRVTYIVRIFLFLVYSKQLPCSWARRQDHFQSTQTQKSGEEPLYWTMATKASPFLPKSKSIFSTPLTKISEGLNDFRKVYVMYFITNLTKDISSPILTFCKLLASAILKVGINVSGNL